VASRRGVKALCGEVLDLVEVVGWWCGDEAKGEGWRPWVAAGGERAVGLRVGGDERRGPDARADAGPSEHGR
jgi:hypothetical protein